ncbi:MAG: hypothetical protein RMJ67_03915 [Elusimicrobiota bacterium]|nr:hypothetical protein [Endomicrobiia bacterium]MDW8165637.1 hypothetical protein [Elusimicrobiota bacterium]
MKQKKYKILKTLIFFVIIISIGKTNTLSLFNEAVDEYKKGNFTNALEKFLTIKEELHKNKKISAEVFYNIGNCYFRLNQLGLSRYYYELAKLCNYHNKNINYNLNLVKKLTGNNLEENLMEQIVSFFSFNELLILIFILNLIFFSSIILNIFLTSKLLKWAKRISGILFGILFILGIIRYINETKLTGIIIEPTNLLSAPTELGQTKSIQINEAKKVIILTEKEDFYAVYLKQDKIQGWIKKDKIKTIKL